MICIKYKFFYGEIFLTYLTKCDLSFHLQFGLLNLTDNTSI
jgi:hypothetical protein